MTKPIFNPYAAQLAQLETDINANEQLLADAELGPLAQEELTKLQDQKQALLAAEADFQAGLTATETDDADPTLHSPAILEIRAGAGGDEAKIWAGELLRMYLRYAESHHFKIELIDDLIVKISGHIDLNLAEDDTSTSLFAYQLFKTEAGVHRVQRVPVTEAQGRIHTSTASVAVLPEIQAHHIEIREEDLTWEFMRSGGAGGQSVNKTNSAVRLIHRPTQIMIHVSQERKQLQNRQIALDLLRGKLWEIEEEKKASQLSQARTAIGRNLRSEKIRTYNFPQNRITDHRLNQSWYQLSSIMEGDLDKILSAVHHFFSTPQEEKEVNPNSSDE